MADDLTAGTTAPAAADPAVPGTTAQSAADGKTGAEPSGTPDLAAERDELQRKYDELLRMKGNYEGWERERSELLAQLRPSTTEPGAEEVARIQRTVATLQQRAFQENDDVAYTLLQMMTAMQQQPVKLREEMELREVPKDERSEVQRVQREAWEQRGERITPATAKRLLEADRLSQQAEALRKREDEIRRTEDARARGVVQTRTVPVPSNDVPSMTFSEFRRAYAEASPEQREKLYERTAGGTRNLKPD